MNPLETETDDAFDDSILIVDQAFGDEILVIKGGGVGFNVGGRVVVKPVREWHRLAMLEVKNEADEAGRSCADRG